MKHYKIGDLLDKSDFNKISNELDRRWQWEDEIEPGKTVYFENSVQISRKEFKKQYPDNPIVRDLSKADYCICNNKISTWFSFHNSSVIALGDNGWRSEERLRELNKMVDFVSGHAIPINAKSIEFSSENGEMPEEMIQKIQYMLKSPDKETLDLGIKILFQYDHMESLDTFYVLLAKANSRTWYRRTKSRVTEQKIKFIKEQFTNHRF